MSQCLNLIRNHESSQQLRSRKTKVSKYLSGKKKKSTNSAKPSRLQVDNKVREYTAQQHQFNYGVSSLVGQIQLDTLLGQAIRATLGNLRKVIGCCRIVSLLPVISLGIPCTIYHMTFTKGPKDPYFPNLCLTQHSKNTHINFVSGQFPLRKHC